MRRESAKQYRFMLMLAADDEDALWSTAAREYEQSGLTPCEIAELIGPEEDPSPSDCLVSLLLPRRLPGCRILDFSLEETGRVTQRFGDVSRQDGADPRPAKDQRPPKSRNQ